MNLRIITKNHAADSKIGSPLKIDFRADWTHESIPTAWELTIAYNNANFGSGCFSSIVSKKFMSRSAETGSSRFLDNLA